MTLLHATARPANARRRRLLAPGLTIAGLGLATLAVQVRDPHVAGSWGACPSVVLFGVWCPACGGLRAVHDLGHGDLVAAASSNLLLVAALPFVLAALAGWLYVAWSGRRITLPKLPVVTGLAIGLGVVVAFTVLRNLNAGSWLAP